MPIEIMRSKESSRRPDVEFKLNYPKYLGLRYHGKSVDIKDVGTGHLLAIIDELRFENVVLKDAIEDLRETLSILEDKVELMECQL